MFHLIQSQFYGGLLGGFASGLHALLQQAHDLLWEAGEVHHYALLSLQVEEVVLAHFQDMQEEEVLLAGQLYPEHLQEVTPLVTCLKILRLRFLVDP